MVTVELSGKLPSDMKSADVIKLAGLSIKMVKSAGNFGVSISLVTDTEIRRLNKIWRGEDKVTDVLSFGFKGSAGFIDGAAVKTRQIGDVVISLPQVRRQARVIGRPVRQELSLIIVHGLLHLLGLDHDTRRREQRMFGLQQEVLLRAGIF